MANIEPFSGLAVDITNIFRLSDAKSRSISPENFTGEKGRAAMATDGPAANAARDLGQGWKVSPWVWIDSGQTFTLCDIKRPGAIQHIWMTPAGIPWRFAIIRIYWDDEETPSVECPLGDFFACGWGNRNDFRQVNSIPVTVNPGSAFNCYWPMPFRKRCRITIENRHPDRMSVYYSIDYVEAHVPEDAAYLHAQFRRTNPLPYKEVYTILDGVKGKGHYVGTYMAWGVNNNGWWGEGEFKAYIDGDTDFPTIAGTGTEDYFCGSYNFENLATKRYTEFSTPYAGMPLVIKPDGTYISQQRFSLYRWHVPDPIRFESNIRVTIQALGWRVGGRYLPLQDDIASVAFWYQREPHAQFPDLPDRDYCEII